MLLASQMPRRKQVRCPEGLETEEPARVRLRAKRDRQPNSGQEVSWEKIDDIEEKERKPVVPPSSHSKG